MRASRIGVGIAVGGAGLALAGGVVLFVGWGPRSAGTPPDPVAADAASAVVEDGREASERLDASALRSPAPTPEATVPPPAAEDETKVETEVEPAQPATPLPDDWRPWSIEGRVRGVRPEAPWSTPLRLEFLGAVPSATLAVPPAPSGDADAVPPRLPFDPAATAPDLVVLHRATIEASEDGRYTLGEDEQPLAEWLGGARRLRLSADDPRYTPAVATLDLDPDEAWCPRRLVLDLRVLPAVGVRGVVVGPDTRAVPGIAVSLFELEGEDGEEAEFAAVAGAHTDANGRYRLRAPRVAQFLVVAHRDGREDSPRLRELMPAAARVRGLPGDDTRAPLLTMQRGARVSGTVRIEEIGPLPGVRVLARSREPRGQRLRVEDCPPMRWEHERVELEVHVAWTDERGEWEMRDLATGREFEVSVADLVGVAHPRTVARARRRIVPPAESVHLLLSGSILDLKVADGRGLPRAAPVLVRQGERSTLESIPADGRLGLLLQADTATSLQLRAPGYRIQDLDLRSPAAGRTASQALRLALDERTTLLRGRVRCAAGLPPRVRVRWRSQNPEREPRSEVLELDTNGAFVLEDLPLGPAWLRVEPASSPSAAEDVPASFLFHPTEVPVRGQVDRPDAEVSLTLRRAGALRVHPPEGKDRARCWLGLTPAQARWLDGVDLGEVVRQRGLVLEVLAPAVVAPSLLPPGTYSVRVAGSDATHELRIEAGEVTDWTLQSR